MKWRLREYIIFGFVTLGSSLIAGQCSVEILNEKFSGEKIRLHFVSKLNSKAQCKKLADMHRPNFNSNQVKYKQVDYKWYGYDSRKSLISKVTRKKRLQLSKSKTDRKKHSNQF